MRIKGFFCSILGIAFLGTSELVEAVQLVVPGNEIQSTSVIPAWRGVTNTGAPPAHFWSSAIWTGTEMIVFGSAVCMKSLKFL